MALNIIVSTDKNYLKYTRVLMVSAYENIKNSEVDFYVLHTDLRAEDEAYLKEVSDMYKQNLHMIYVDRHLFYEFPQSKIWPVEALYDLVPHLLLPDNLDRALYLDIDTIINGDISEFYNQPLDDCYILASRCKYDSRNEPDEEFSSFDFEPDFNDASAAGGGLINAGVLLYNLRALRKNNIDIPFYLKKIYGYENVFFDQGIISLALKKHIKILKTCKYNCRALHFLFEYDSPDNLHRNDELKYTINEMSIGKIFHYCGASMEFKPWDYRFKPSDLGDKSFLRAVPEVCTIYDIWWKYAEKVPDYAELNLQAQINTSTYRVIRKLLLDRKLEFNNLLGVEGLNVPAWRNMNSIRKNEDLNNFTLPRVYRCVDAATKVTVKNLPAEFMQKCGFRLVVKYIAANDGDNTSVLQILEPNEPTASIYRRFGHKSGKGWSKWYKVATTDEVRSIEGKIEQTNSDVKLKLTGLEKQFSKLQSELKLVQKLQYENARLKGEYNTVRNSLSFKVGRMITFIPRKLRNAFKRKN